MRSRTAALLLVLCTCLSPGLGSIQTARAEKNPTIITLTKATGMRESPEDSAALLHFYPRGTELVVESSSLSWFGVYSPTGERGWIRASDAAFANRRELLKSLALNVTDFTDPYIRRSGALDVSSDRAEIAELRRKVETLEARIKALEKR